MREAVWNGKARCFNSGGIWGNNLLWVSGKIVCKQMNSSRSSGRKDDGGTGHCSERAHKTLDSSELFSFLRTAFFKGLFLFACYTSAQAESFLSSFNPFFYFAGGKKTTPQNQVPRSALVAKSERAAASFFSLSPSPESELWIALQNWLLWMDQGGEKKMFNRIRGRLCSRNLLLKQVETGPCSLYK